MKKNEILKKQIIYRATHRGTKEMDLFLGNFVKKNIDIFTTNELKSLEILMKIEDEILEKWYFKNRYSNLIPENKISKMLREFKF